jgi:hypothetical protein
MCLKSRLSPTLIEWTWTSRITVIIDPSDAQVLTGNIFNIDVQLFISRYRLDIVAAELLLGVIVIINCERATNNNGSVGTIKHSEAMFTTPIGNSDTLNLTTFFMHGPGVGCVCRLDVLLARSHSGVTVESTFTVDPIVFEGFR